MTKEKIKAVMPDESERKLFYSDSTADFSQALAGYLRMDFGMSGKEFWNTWHGTDNNLAGSVTFIAELNSLISELRKSLLKSRSAMTKYIREHDGI